MKIIGEKINGTRKRVAQAIAERDTEFIKDLAIKQSEAGAAWLDVNAGTHPDQEPDDLVWLIENIQSVTETPLCIDTANPKALGVAIRAVNKTPMINSISGEPDRLEDILPIVAANHSPVIALAMGGTKISETAEGRMEVVRKIMAATRDCGVPDDNVYIDPLAMTIATMTDSAVVALETMRAVKEEFPQAHLTMGLSNISFGLPARSYINRAFLTLALSAGLDSAIVDPMDKELKAAMIAAELVLGRDNYCLAYTRAYRAGVFGEVVKK